MTLNQQDKDTLIQNWEGTKTQIKAQFPDVSDADLERAQRNPDQLTSAITDRTGQDPTEVEQALKGFVQTLSGGSQGQAEVTDQTQAQSPNPPAAEVLPPEADEAPVEEQPKPKKK